MYEYRKKLYVANEETNQLWDETDIPEFISMWKSGIDQEDIKEYFGMDEFEYVLLAVDLLAKNKINGRINIVRAIEPEYDKKKK